MAALSSYTPIATHTIPTAVSSYTFSSIPATYTDLVLVASVNASTAADQFIRFNGDTASNYSTTLISGTGSAASSYRQSNDKILLDFNGTPPTAANTFNTNIINIQNYANTTTYKTLINRNGAAGTGVEACVGTWRSTAAINSITFLMGSGNLSVGTTLSLYGIANNTAGAKATGGVISSDSSYFYHSFYETGTFTPTQSLSCDYLVVAGGGGGAGSDTSGEGGGGGGAGGLRSTVTATGGGGTLESALSVTAQAYTITVGAGGAGGTSGSRDGTNGSNSVFSSITSTGGGAGGTNGGFTGGSGGGASYASIYPPGSGTANQGFAGGIGSASRSGGGGGGGGGAVGSAASTPNGGAGGVGVATIISGTSTYYAGGGGGSAGTSGTGGAGGAGGGGAGKVGTGGTGTAGTIGTGGGGGAGSGSSGIGGLGGSGVVIIRYAR